MGDEAPPATARSSHSQPRRRADQASASPRRPHQQIPAKSEKPDSDPRHSFGTPHEFTEAARPCRHAPGDRWFVDETYLKVAGKWTYLYRAIDQHGQVIDVLLSMRRDLAAARRFFTRALRAGTIPVEVTTDRAHVYPRVLDELLPSALHTIEQYANNPVEADHGQLKARLRPMRGLKRHRSAQILAAGHAFVQNLRCGHYDIATDVPNHHRLRIAFHDLALTI